MSEIEVPIEAVQENIHHAAHHASDDERTFMITAIAVLTRKKILFMGSIGLGLAGIAWALKGFLF